MAWTQADIDALDRAIAEAGLADTVTYADGTSIRNISRKDALALRDRMAGDLRAASGKTYRAVRITPRSGY